MASILASCSSVSWSDSLERPWIGSSQVPTVRVGLLGALNKKKKIRIYIYLIVLMSRTMYGTMFGTMYTYSMYFELLEWWPKHMSLVL